MIQGTLQVKNAGNSSPPLMLTFEAAVAISRNPAVSSESIDTAIRAVRLRGYAKRGLAGERARPRPRACVRRSFAMRAGAIVLLASANALL